MEDLLNTPLGQIARRVPGATRVLDAHGFDFCCGGNHTLRDAAAKAGVDPHPVVDELQRLRARIAADGEADWSEAPPVELIDHILERFHATHREQLPELIRLARKVEQVHGERADCPHGLADHLQTMAQELESHMLKEENVLFPLIKSGRGTLATMPIGVMRGEHDAHGEALRRLGEITANFTQPRDACTTWRALMNGVRTLREDLMQHIHLENNVLFERYAPAAVAA